MIKWEWPVQARFIAIIHKLNCHCVPTLNYWNLSCFPRIGYFISIRAFCKPVTCWCKHNQKTWVCYEMKAGTQFLWKFILVWVGRCVKATEEHHVQPMLLRLQAAGRATGGRAGAFRSVPGIWATFGASGLEGLAPLKSFCRSSLTKATPGNYRKLTKGSGGKRPFCRLSPASL